MLNLLIRTGLDARTIALSAIILRLIQLLRYKDILSASEARSIFTGAMVALAPLKGTVAVDDAVRLLGKLFELLPEKNV